MDVKSLVQFLYSRKGRAGYGLLLLLLLLLSRAGPSCALIHSLPLLDRIPVLASTHELHSREFLSTAVALEKTAWL